MNQYQRPNSWVKNSLLAVTLPLAVIVVLFADNLLALSDSGNHSLSLIESQAKTWQDEALNDKLGANYLELDAQNRLVGSVTAIEEGTGMTIPVPGLQVKLVQRSEVVTQSLTDGNGNFVTAPLKPGSYTLCMSGNEGFLAYGIQVIDNDADKGEAFEMPNLQGATNPIAPEENQFVRYRLRTAQATDIKAAVIPPTHDALKEIINGIPSDVGLGDGTLSGKTRINIEDSVIAGGFQVSLTEDQTLVGQINPLAWQQDEPIRLQEMSVYLLKNDQIMAQVNADSDGKFMFNDVAPGVYGFAAAGRSGFAALSFQAVAAETTPSSASLEVKTFKNASATNSQAAGALSVTLAPPEDIPFLRREINSLGNNQGVAQNAMPMNNMLPGGMGGYGGGGGYGGIGGFGGWLQLGIAAWVLTELFNNENDNVPVPPVVPPAPQSPFAPTVLQTGN